MKGILLILLILLMDSSNIGFLIGLAVIIGYIIYLIKKGFVFRDTAEYTKPNFNIPNNNSKQNSDIENLIILDMINKKF